MDKNFMAQDKNKWLVVVNTAMNIWCPYSAGSLVAVLGTVHYSLRKVCALWICSVRWWFGWLVCLVSWLVG